MERSDPVDIPFVDIWPRAKQPFRLLKITDLCGVEKCGPTFGVSFVQYVIREWSGGIRTSETFLIYEWGLRGKTPRGGVWREGHVPLPSPILPLGIRGELSR